MATMIFDLPRDLIEEILSRVPLISKKATRLTCKNLNTYLTEMNQRKLAAEAKEGESRIIVWNHNDLYLASIKVNENPSTKFLGKLTCLDEQVNTYNVTHCEGLLLIISYPKIVVWNPYLGQTRWIETNYSHKGEYGWFKDRYTYALGYENNNSCRNHKILRFCDYRYRDDWYTLYEIYDFDSDLWLALDVPPHWSISNYGLGLSLKGNSYWCTSSEHGEEGGDYITCFDFTRERFGLPMRLPFSDGYNDSVTLSCVREEKLVVLVTHMERNEISVWITTKIEDEKVSWSKFFTVDKKPDYWVCTWSLFIDKDKKVVMGFGNPNYHTISIIGEDGYLRKLGFVEHVDTCYMSKHVCSYVPSLVQIKQPTEAKRKKRKVV